jgi:hypothetical protein
MAGRPVALAPRRRVEVALPPEKAPEADIPAKRRAEAPPGARAHHKPPGKPPNLDHDVIFNPFK